MIYRVILSDPARDDLDQISAWVDEQANRQIAELYDQRIRKKIATLSRFSHRGTRDDQIAEGIRTLSFERRLRIAYRVAGDVVEVYRVFHGARNVDRL